MLIFQQKDDFSTVPQHPRRYTHKTSGCKMLGFKTSGFKNARLQNVRFTKRQVSKRLVSKRPIFKFDILIKQKYRNCQVSIAI
jgi:hypothetical protein